MVFPLPDNAMPATSHRHLLLLPQSLRLLLPRSLALLMMLACLWTGIWPSAAQASPRTLTPDADHAQPDPFPDDHVRASIRPPDARHAKSGGDPFPDDSAQPSVWPVDANHATVRELQTLRGVGPAMAERIIAARTERPFDSFEDFASRVRGAGPKRLQQWRAAGLTLRSASSSIQDAMHLQTGKVHAPTHLRGAQVPARAVTSGQKAPERGLRAIPPLRRQVSAVPAGKPSATLPLVVPAETIVGHPAVVSSDSGTRALRRTGGATSASRSTHGSARASHSTDHPTRADHHPTRAHPVRSDTELARSDGKATHPDGRPLRRMSTARTRRSHPSGDISAQRTSMAAGCHGASRSWRQTRTGKGSGHGGRASGQVRSRLPSMFDARPLFDCQSLFDERSRLAPRS